MQKEYIPISSSDFESIMLNNINYNEAIQRGFREGYLDIDSDSKNFIFKGISIDKIAININKISSKYYYFKLIGCKVTQISVVDINNKTFEIIIEDSIIEDISIKNSIISKLRISKNSIIGDVFLGGDNTVETIEIVDNTKIKNLMLRQSVIENVTIFNNCLIGIISISKNSEVKGSLLGKSVISSFTIENSKFSDLNLVDFSEINRISIGNNSSLEDIKIDNSKAEKVEVINSKTNDLTIGNSSTLGDFFISDSQIGDIFIQRKSTTKNFNFTKSSVKNIYILYSSMTQNFSIFEKTTIANIYVEYDSKCGYYLIKHSSIKNLRIKNRSTVEEIDIYKSNLDSKQLIEDFQIDDSRVKSLKLYEIDCDSILISKSVIGKIELGKISIKKQLEVLDNSKVYMLRIQGKENRRVVLQNSYFQNFEWKQDNFCMMNINNCQIETLLFEKCTIPKDSVFQISDTSINKVKFSLFTNTAWLNIINLRPLTNYKRFKERYVKSVLNIDIDKFVNGFSESQIELINSDLGKTSFINCNLASFKRFVFYNTKLLEVFLGGTKLPLEIELPNSNILERIEKSEQQRLAFGQFKKIYENRGDNVTATEYLSRELEVYRHELTHRSNVLLLRQKNIIINWWHKKNPGQNISIIDSEIYNSIPWYVKLGAKLSLLKNKKWWDMQGERINLWLGYVSSYHNTNWIRATLVTLLVNFYLFWNYCLWEGYGMGNDFNTFFKLLPYGFEFLNPLRKADFLRKSHIIPASKPFTEISLAWDYVSRMIVAYFAYQTIQAFRRFGKSK